MSNATGVGRSSRIVLFVASAVMLALAVGVFVGSSAADAQTLPQPLQSPCDPYTKHCQPIVKPTLLFNDPQRIGDRELVTPPPPSEPPHRCTGPNNCLPFTGADLTLFAATGFAAIGTGTVLVRATRSRKRRA